MSRNPSMMAMSVCPDKEVHEYVEALAGDFNLYAPPGKMMTAEQVLAAARKQFGDRRCIGLVYWIH